jgi:hypothetical protein
LPVLSDHNANLAPDVVTSLYINYEWRRLISDALQSYADSIIRNLDDALVDDYRNKFQVLINDLYSVDAPLAAGYRARVLATNPIRFNPLAEGGGTSIVDITANNFSGVYSGVTWDGTLSPFGEAVPSWDGVNDYGELLSAAFSAAFNLNEGCILFWFRAANAGMWSDGVSRRIVEIARIANNTDVTFNKSSAPSGQLSVLRRTAGTLRIVSFDGLSTTNWISLMASWSVAANQFRGRINGTLVTTHTAPSAIGSGLVRAYAGVSNHAPPTNVMHAYLSNLVIWDTPEDAAKIALMTP